MAGDERVRFCKHCSKHVFNLSALTRPEAERLIREKEGKFCGRFHQRHDGRMLTADCPTGLRRCREQVSMACAAFIGAMAILLTGCRRPVVMGQIAPPQMLQGEVQVSPSTPPEAPTILGDIAIVPRSVPETNNSASGE